VLPKVKSEISNLKHRCPAGSLRSGYNDFEIKQQPGEREQTIVWAELRIVPN
jgi:hypothetical protein